jgi:Sulfotransferase domain
MQSDFITIVSGLPRSGTSLMMQMLAAGGLTPLTDNLRAADESNLRGYFEFEPVKRLRSDRSWLDQARGHAVKIVHILVRELPADGQFHYRLLLMKRPMEEILASQRAMLEHQGKASADDATLAKIFRSQLEQLEQWLAAQPAFSFLAVDYHRVLKEPLEVAREVNAFLQTNLNLEAMAAAVDPALYRQRLA